MQYDFHNYGSSPLARGALAVVASRGLRGGIIPACAGSTPGGASRTPPGRDHPRLRGEHSASSAPSVCRTGSSPLARGAHVGRHVVALRHGIIPACAGSTGTCAPDRSAGRDHPRLRGEYCRSFRVLLGLVGSSPLARGALLPLLLHERGGGIIPACAGSTSTDGRSTSSRRDHPRLRGEHSS